jgi:hypothetical protein
MRGATSPAAVPAPSYWGNCPRCLVGSGEHLNVGPRHWFVCHDCKTKWSGGEDVFSGWLHEDRTVHLENARLLDGYTSVEAYFAPKDVVEAAMPVYVPPTDEDVSW